jgi:hypothetical protein
MSELIQQIKRDINADIYYQQNFPNDGQRFLAWYLRNIYLRSPVQAKDDITDGPDDKEFDAVIVDDEKHHVIVIQSKFYNSTSVDHQPLQEILAAWLQIRNLAALQENANNRLKVKLETISQALQDDYEVVFELVTTGQLTASATKDLSLFQTEIGEFEHPESSITLVDETLLKRRWDEALSTDLPPLSHSFQLEAGKYLNLTVAGFQTVLAAIRLCDCLELPGIRDQKLFRPNVRQSLGLTNKINKGLKQTINGDSPQYFFVYHNGITALCSKMELDRTRHTLSLKGLGVVNGCQSLNTILACSEKAKVAKDTYVLFRFYEIPQKDMADKISVYTNSQSGVKPRDLRSNDKRVTALKRAYENTYRDGYLKTKRGEERPADKDESKTIDISLLAKCLMTWQCQRPIIAYNENKLFDKYFELLFRGDYAPADILALNQWMQAIERRWAENNLNLNEALVAAPSYSKFHLMFAVQACFCVVNNQTDKVPFPSATNKVLVSPDAILDMAATCYNSALDAAVFEYNEKNKIFSPQNWLKAKDSILKVQNAVRMYMGMIANAPGGPELKKSLVIPPDKFGLRWSAD